MNITKLNKIQNLIIQIPNSKLQKSVKNSKYALTPDGKKIFAYQYYNKLNGICLIDFLKQSKEINKNNIKMISHFIIENHMLKNLIPDSIYEFRNPISKRHIETEYAKRLSLKDIIRSYNYQNWLEPFNEDEIFAESKNKHPQISSFIKPDGSTITFDKTNAIKVKMAIIDQGIFPARCIVEGAYSPIAKGQFKQYIKQIKNYNGGQNGTNK